MRVGAVPVVLLAIAACDAGSAGPVLELPPRPADAPGGRAIMDDVRDLELEAREARFFEEVARGNVPGWLRHLEPVEVTAEVDGAERRATFWAAPDYLAVGSDDDYVFVPLSPRTARRVADLVGGALPTPRMVDALWLGARDRLVPIRFPPNEHMWSVRYLERHNRLVQAQRRQGPAPGALVAGHKVDVVRLAAPSADSLPYALYGWHLSDGEPVQPLAPVAPDFRPHFSMGVRVVGRRVLVDGVERDIADVLRDPGLAPLLRY